jgi:hypothetical protein
MPVVTPSRASMETVNAVDSGAVLLKRLYPLAGERQADQPAPVHGHEVDRLGGRLLGGDDQVALVLAVLVIDQDDHAAGGDVGDDFLGCGQRGVQVDAVVLAACLTRFRSRHVRHGQSFSRSRPT